MHFLLRLDASAVFLLFFVNFNDPPRYLLLIGSKMITKHYSDGQPPHSLSTSSLQQGFCTDFNEGAGGRAAGRRKEFPSPGKCIGKVILGQNKEILSLNSGQNLLPEEEWKSINEVLYFLWVCCVFFLFFVLCMEKEAADFIYPGMTPALNTAAVWSGTVQGLTEDHAWKPGWPCCWDGWSCAARTCPAWAEQPQRSAQTQQGEAQLSSSLPPP